jgi:tRNA1Val (adenine37-N6)-methyltransferase
MSNPYFRFKQFTVRHDRCAMKVGTDGALLGAWASVERTARALDVGAGTGLVALMLAQRGAAAVDAVEIDPEACAQAAENIGGSPFSERIRVFCMPFADYAPARKYDLIVSNPPFFAHSLKCPDGRRRLARHDDRLPLPALVARAAGLLADDGRLALILPAQLAEDTERILAAHRLHILRRTNVVPVEGASPKRFLIEASPRPLPAGRPAADTLVLETAARRRTPPYCELMKDFYL